MHFRTVIGKAVQLGNSSPTLWLAFIRGWIQRQQRGVVPCLMPEATRLLYLAPPDFYGSYEYFSETRQGRKEIAFFLQKLKAGDVLYDIGSYRGVYSVASKLKLGDAVTVHAFEPVAPNTESIARICALNHFSGVNIVPMAVGEGGCVSGNVNSEDGVLRLGDSATTDKAQFKTISLDDYISNGASPPSVMKIDVEGYELSVLIGAQRCLEKYRPRLWLEVHPHFLGAQGKSREDVFKQLRNIGYTISIFEDHESPDRELPFHVWCV